MPGSVDILQTYMTRRKTLWGAQDGLTKDSLSTSGRIVADSGPFCTGTLPRPMYRRGLQAHHANAAARMTLPILVLCLSTSIYTGVWAGDGSKHVGAHQHKSRGSHGVGHRVHARTTHRTLVSKEATADRLPDDGVLRATRGDPHPVPHVVQIPREQDDQSANLHARLGTEEYPRSDAEWEDGRPQALPKPLAEEDMTPDDTGGEGLGASSNGSTSPLPDSKLFHIPDRLQQQILPSEGFVYVYDLPSRFNKDILDYRAEWHPMQYDTDQHLHRRMMASRVRTADPDAAKLFLLPVYVGRYYDYYWQKWSPDGQPWAVPGPSGGWEKWEWAMGNTSALVREAILHVRRNFPYWDRSNGADHFMVFAYDKGRCEQALHLGREEAGKMFFIQSYNDLVFRSDPTLGIVSGGGGTLRTHSYEWTEQPYVHCFKPNVDVAVPAYASYRFSDIVHPHATQRNYTVLARFGYRAGDGKNTVQHHGHRLRKEIMDWWAENPIPGGDIGTHPDPVTEDDMRHAVFCICPPGHTQDTSRVWRAIIMGCIPVTFFRAVDLPFRRFLGVRYEDFMLNIQPDDYKQLAAITGAILTDPPRLRRMQLALAAHQRLFVWEEGQEESQGAFGALYKELQLRTDMVRDYVSVF
eukprot:jgi/Botrbrau1/4184/Bobra.0192s0044.1